MHRAAWIERRTAPLKTSARPGPQSVGHSNENLWVPGGRNGGACGENSQATQFASQTRLQR